MKATEAVPAPQRLYWRCRWCLSRAVTEEPRLVGEILTCGACGGPIEYLGPVERGRWLRVEDRSPCDNRCTGALGPSCDCSCNGANHGKRLVVEVKRDGGAARVDMPDAETCRARAGEYLDAIARVHKLLAAWYPRSYPRWQAREWVDSDAEWQDLHWYGRELATIATLRTHAGRMRRLTALLAELGTNNQMRNGHGTDA